MSAPNSSTNKDHIEERVKTELQPVFLDFYRGSAKEKVYARNADWFARRVLKGGNIVLLLSNAPIVMQIVNEDLAKYVNAPNEEAVFKLKASRKTLGCLNAFSYVAFVETLATPYIDLSILLLSVDGYHFHVGADRKHNYVRHAMSFRDLESPSVSLANKLDFLDSCKLTFFSKWVDRNLRNIIAHLGFDIDDNGDFYRIENRIEGERGEQKKVKLNLTERLQTFVKYYGAVTDVFTEEMKNKIYAPKKGESE